MMSTKPGKPACGATDREKRAAGKLAVKERERLIGEVDQLATLGVPPAHLRPLSHDDQPAKHVAQSETMVVSLPAVNLQIEAVKEVLTAINPDSRNCSRPCRPPRRSAASVNAPETEAEKQACATRKPSGCTAPAPRAAVIA